MDENRADKFGRSSSIVIRNKTYDSLTTLNELQNKSKERVENQNRNVPLTTVENEVSTKKEIQTATESKKENDTYNFDFTNFSNSKMNISPDANKNMTETQNSNISISSKINEQAKKRIESQNENIPKTEIKIKDEISTKKEIKTALETKTQKNEDISIGMPNGLGNQYKATGIEIKTIDKNIGVSEESVTISSSEKIKTEVKKEFSTEKRVKTSVENELKNNIHVSSKSKQIFESAKFRAKSKVEKKIIDSVKSELDEQEDLGTDNISAIITATDNSIRGLREGKRTVEKVKSHLQSKREKKYYNDTVQANGKQNRVQTTQNSDKEYRIHSQIKNDTIKTSIKAKYDTSYSLSSNAASIDKTKKGYEIASKTIENPIKTASGNGTVSASMLGNTATAGATTTIAGATTTTAGVTVAETATAIGVGATVTTAGGAAATASASTLPVIAIVSAVIVVVIIVIALIIGIIGMLSPNISSKSEVDINETKWITEKVTQEREDLITEIKKLYNDNKGDYDTITFSNTLNSSNTTLDNNNLAIIENDMYTVGDYVQAMQPVFHTLLLERYELLPSDNEMEEVFNELWEKMNFLTTQITQQTVNTDTADTEQDDSQNADEESSESETTIKTFTIILNTNGYYDLINAYYLNDINILEAKTGITDDEKKRLGELNEYYTLCTTYADILQESGEWLDNGIVGTSAYIPEGGYMPSEAYDDATVGAIFTEANKWLGTPYEMPPNMPTTFDCSGFVWYVFQHSGVKNWGRTTAQGIFDQCTPIAMGEAKAGDLVFFQGTYNAGRTVTHIGIYCGDGTMIHAGNPVKRASINTPYWQQHFYSFGRLN